MTDKPILAVLTHKITHLYHGAIYVNRPTPSGCDRWLLQTTTNEGYQTSRSAALIMNERFPEYVQIEIDEDDIEIDKSLNNIIKRLKPGNLLTLVKAKNPIELDFVELKEYDSMHCPTFKTDITVGQLNELLYKNIIEYVATSGDDPELHYQYYYYTFIGEHFD